MSAITVELENDMKTVEDYIRSIPDFPEPGIIFRDITSVLQDPEGLQLAIDSMQKELEGIDFDVIAGAESRGFIFGMPLAYNLKKGFVRFARRASCLARRLSRSMRWSMAQQLLKCIRIPSSPVRRLSSSTI